MKIFASVLADGENVAPDTIFNKDRRNTLYKLKRL